MASRFNPLKADAHWQKVWEESDALRARADSAGPKARLPASSARLAGRIHVGHGRNYVMADVLARYRRMQGVAVLHPIGRDASGVPAENAAIGGNVHAGEWTRTLRRLGILETAEPARGPSPRGMVTHPTYRDPAGHWLLPDEAEAAIAAGRPVVPGPTEEMSESWKNVIPPEPIVEQYGADALRWFLLSDSPPERDRQWTDAGIEGAWRFVQRLWRLASADAAGEGGDEALDRKLHRTVAAVGANIEALAFNKAVAAIHALANAIEQAPPSASRRAAVETMVRLVAPMLPHVAEEAWAAAGREGLVADAAWPEADPALLAEDEVTIAVQVNGRLRDTLTVPRGAPREALEALALASEKVVKILAGRPPGKVIVVPDRLLNLVA